MKNIAQWCYRRRRLTVAVWVLVLVVVGALSQSVGSEYDEDFKLPDTESRTAYDLLIANAPAQSGETDTIVVRAKNGTVDDPAFRASMDKLAATVRDMPHVSSIGDIYNPTGGDAQVSTKRDIAFATLQLDGQIPDPVTIEDLENIVDTVKAANSDIAQVAIGGPSVAFVDSGGEGNMHLTEIIGLSAAAIVLFVAFGSVFTMFLPLLTAVLALGTGLSIIGFLTHAFSIADFGPQLATLIGLGVGVDYALFIISRHRVNLMHGMSPEESVITAIDTSGRAVLFAGITVCIGILGLMLLGVSFFYGLALSVVTAVLMTMIAAVTFLPAMLGFVGMKALSRKQRRTLQERGAASSHEDLSPGWFRWSRLVERHPVSLGSLALVAMLVLAIPTLDIRLGTTDAGGDKKGTTTRTAYDLLAEGFGPGFNGPLQIVAPLEGVGDIERLQTLTEQMKQQDNVASVTPFVALPGDKVAMAQVYPGTTPQAKETTDLIDDLRAEVLHPYTASGQGEIYVGGVTAVFHDFTIVIAEKLPVFMGVVVGLSFILLMAVFRSLLIPLVASVMNLLSAAASFGVVVAIFQWGWGASLFGIEQTGPIMAFLPVMAFAILFGLSMDYEVFLVSRMYEEWHRTQDNEQAIALGQAETGRVISAAAAIMVVIFGSFLLMGDPIISLFGISLASAVLLDAMVIRTILVPALMHVFGKANWYLPHWLDRVLPRLNVEPPSAPPVS